MCQRAVPRSGERVGSAARYQAPDMRLSAGGVHAAASTTLLQPGIKRRACRLGARMPPTRSSRVPTRTRAKRWKGRPPPIRSDRMGDWSAPAGPWGGQRGFAGVSRGQPGDPDDGCSRYPGSCLGTLTTVHHGTPAAPEGHDERWMGYLSWSWGTASAIRIHGGFLQPGPAPLYVGVPDAGGFRGADQRRAGRIETVYEIGVTPPIPFRPASSPCASHQVDGT